jgi:Reverse transcriptase (RNA-dependent DNA polymerase)
MSIVVSREELQLAWRRYKRDLSKRCFVVHPHLVQWIESDLDSWLSDIASELASGYSPRPARLIAVPKAGNLVRPATILEPEDAVVFNILVGLAFPNIARHLKWSQGTVDIAYPLAESPDSIEWTRFDFLIWQNFRAKSLLKLNEDDIEYAVLTDITGFYENIDLQRLSSDLSGIEVSKGVVDLLQNCLRNWALPRNEGIPQGYSASDILGKLYLDSVDRNLSNAGLSHVRYVDDIRVFCPTKLEAKRSIRRLSGLLYPRGLNLQSAKTDICDKTHSRQRIDGVTEIIQNLNRKLARELAESGVGYLKPSEVLNALQTHEGPMPEILERAFSEYFAEATGRKFDSTLYHYLLVRLGKVGSREAILYSLGLLRNRPEETEDILAYFSQVGLEPGELSELIAFAGSDEAIYDYQLYQILKWLYDLRIIETDVIKLCRSWISDHNRDASLRSYALAYVGAFGPPTELTDFEESYSEADTELERADRVAAVSRMERGRRNTFYARVAGHGKLLARAVVVAKERT